MKLIKSYENMFKYDLGTDGKSIMKGLEFIFENLELV